MKPTQLTVRLIAAAASTVVTIALFQSVAALAEPSLLTPSAESQATSVGVTAPKVRS